MTNASLSSTVPSNQPETTSSELELTDHSLFTPHITNQHNQPSTDSSHASVTSISPAGALSTTWTSTVDSTVVANSTTNSTSSEVIATSPPMPISSTASTTVEENLTSADVSIAQRMPFLALFRASDLEATLRCRSSHYYQPHQNSWMIHPYVHEFLSCTSFNSRVPHLLIAPTHCHLVIALHVFVRSIRGAFDGYCSRHSYALEHYQLEIASQEHQTQIDAIVTSLTWSFQWTTTTTTTSTTSVTTTTSTSTSSTSTTTTSTSTSSTSTTTSTSSTSSTTSTSTSSATTTSSVTTSTSTSTTSTTTTVTTTTGTTTTTSATTTTTVTTTTSVTTSTSTTTTTTVTTSTTATTTTTSVTTTTESTTTTASTSSTTSVTTMTSSSTSSTSSATTVSTATTSSTTSSTSTAFLAVGSADQSNGTTANSSTDRTGLIVGVVLGSVGFLALVGGIIAAIVIKKGRMASAAALAKPVGRATVISQAPPKSLLQSRLQTRNLRAVKLAPLPTKTSALPPSNIAPLPSGPVVTNPSTFSADRSNLPPRGIPVRLESLRYCTSLCLEERQPPLDSALSFRHSAVKTSGLPNPNNLRPPSTFRPLNNWLSGQRSVPLREIHQEDWQWRSTQEKMLTLNRCFLYDKTKAERLVTNMPSQLLLF